MARMVWLLVLLGAGPACSINDTFQCQSDGECVDGEHAGVCQPEGLCSFPDDGCPSGQRFGEHGGPQAGMCVPTGTGSDVTAPTSESGGDTAIASATGDGSTSLPITSGPASSTGPLDSSTGAPADTGTSDSTGVTPGGPLYQPCDGRCPAPSGCFLHSTMQWAVCAEPCGPGGRCEPFTDSDGTGYETACGSLGDCMVMCGQDGACPLGASCIETFGPGNGACLWPY